MLFLPVFLGEDVFLCFRGRKREENGKKTAKKYFFVGVE